MAYCRHCGAELPEGTRFCPACGAPVQDAPVRTAAEPPIESVAGRPKKRKKPLLKRWWFWVLALIAAAGVLGQFGTNSSSKTIAEPAPPVATAAPKATAAPTAAPTTEPSAEPTPDPQAALSETAIRPEVKAFLDAYEACMDEYVAFMQSYMAADSAGMISMMGDYYNILARYAEFAEKLDALDESELTDAELAYYMEVTGRVSQKLLSVAG